MTTFGAALRRKYLEIGQHEPLRLKYIDGGWQAVRAAMMEPFAPYGKGDLFGVLTERMVLLDGGWEPFCREMFPGSLPPDPNPDYNISGQVAPGEALLAECRRLRSSSSFFSSGGMCKESTTSTAASPLKESFQRYTRLCDRSRT